MELSPPSAVGESDSRWVSVERNGQLVLTKPLYGLPTEWRDGEPPRPQRPTASQSSEPTLHNALSQCYDWMDWFEVCMQHLWKLTIEADVDRSLMVKKHEEAVATVRAKCEEEVQRAQRKLLAPTLHMIEEKEKKADTALAAIAKRETELATAEAGLEQLKEQSKTYQNLCESIHNLGVKNTDALRELKSIASGKAMLEGSVKKWETLHCGTDLRDIIAKVNKRQRIEEDMKRTEQNDLTIAAHKLESELDELASRKATELAKAMDERKTAIRERQELKAKHLKWLAQRGRELNDTTSRAASQAWCDDEIDKLRPVMLAEAERCVATSMKKTWEEEKNHALSMAKEEGRQAGYTYGMQDGHAQGKREGFRLGKEATLEEAYTRVARLEDEIDTRGYDRGYDIGHDIGEATGYAQGYEEGKETGHATGHAEGLVEGESTGYNAGFADGLEEGRQKAVKKFKKKEHISRKENQYIGFHKAMLVVVSEKHKEPLLPQKSKSPAAPYLWGKKVAKFVDDNAMLEDFNSVWYDAHKSSCHSLSLKPQIRHKECDAEDYFDGIADGISGSY